MDGSSVQTVSVATLAVINKTKAEERKGLLNERNCYGCGTGLKDGENSL